MLIAPQSPISKLTYSQSQTTIFRGPLTVCNSQIHLYLRGAWYQYKCVTLIRIYVSWDFTKDLFIEVVLSIGMLWVMLMGAITEIGKSLYIPIPNKFARCCNGF